MERGLPEFVPAFEIPASTSVVKPIVDPEKPVKLNDRDKIRQSKEMNVVDELPEIEACGSESKASSLIVDGQKNAPS